MNRGLRKYLVGASAAALCLIPYMAWTQIAEEEGGTQLDVDLSFGFEHDDDGTIGRTGLGLNFSTATRTQSLSFGVSGGLEFDLDLDPTRSDVEIEDPVYTLNYEYTNGRSRGFVDLRYRERDVDGRLQDGTFDEIDLVEDEGTRIDSDATVGVEIGLTDTMRGALTYRFQGRDFIDTANPDLIDQDRRTLSGQLLFELDPAMTLRFDATYLLEEDDDIFDSRDETLSAAISLDWQIAPELRFSPRVGYGESRVTRTVLGIHSEEIHRGVEVGFDLHLDRPNGSYVLTFDRDFTLIGPRHDVTLTRNFELPGAEITAQVGVVDLPNGTEAFPVGELSYTRDLRLGQVSVSLAHTASVNDQDDQVLRSSLRTRYRHQLPNEASLTLSGAYIESDFTDPTEADLGTLQLSLDYAMPLSDEWDLSAGISHREIREEGAETRDEQRLTLSLTRSYSWRR